MPIPILDTDSDAFLNLPGGPPPFGSTPNFSHPANLSTPGLAALQFGVATLVVAMRLYTKKVVVKRVLSEDWWLVAAYVVFAGFQVNVFMSEYLPLGVHLWELRVRDAIWHAKIFHISTAIYALVQLPLKLALILQIRRIVLPAHTTQYLPSRSRLLLRWTIDFFIAMNVLFYLTLFLFQWLMCRPLRKAWDFRLIVHIASASINTASDLITMILPQPVIWKLNLQRKRKWGLSAVFLLGGL
ncbi:hypothetical protein IQ07DRAFT_627934 [Pyrenochaeta sp. DS3sAY3a]|nr:hypothetical protein IQ07DRAFT_627934 [Pyrenochaeta sp. DS3sAY3a]